MTRGRAPRGGVASCNVAARDGLGVGAALVLACCGGVQDQQTVGDASLGRDADADIPRRIGRYVVIERVGQGAMGVVYAAFDPELSRKLAIKLLHGDGEVAHRRLVREAQALARLSHPNVVQIYDVGTHEGAVYVAMEFAPGQTMRQWLEADPARPWTEILRVLRLAGHGLAAAHDVGIVHRDVKPDNVLVGVDGLVRVVDFGLARAADAVDGVTDDPTAAIDRDALAVAVAALGADETASDSLGERMTRTGARLGTPAYMAPEQWTGGSVDARTDQFAFCVLAWESLYGRRPFGGESIAGLGFAITQGAVGAPPAGTRVPTWIHRLLQQGLKVDPQQRHPDMRTLLRALEHDPAAVRRRATVAVLAAGAVGASVWLGASLAGTAATDPCVAADAALDGVWDDARRREIALALRATGKAYAEDTWTRVEGNLGAWSDRFVAARREACEATHVRHEASAEALDLRVACLDRGRVELAALVDVLAAADTAVLDRAVQATTRLPEPQECGDLDRLADAAVHPDDPTLRERAAALREGVARARALENAGRYDDAAVAIEPLVEPIVALGWPPLVAELRETHGMIAMSRGDATAAQEDLRAAHLAAVEGRHDRVAWSAATALAHALAELPGRVDEARRACDLAQAHWARAKLGDRPAAILEGARFRVEAAAGDYAAARVHIERGIALREREGQVEDADLAGALANYGTIVGILGRPDLAVDSLRRAIAMRERVQAPGHPEVGRDLHNLGSMLAQQREFAEAEPLLERALEIKREALGDAHPDLAYTLVALGNVAVARGRFDVAEARFRDALAIAERAHGPDHPDVAFALAGLGDRYLGDGRPTEALAPLRRALAIREAAQGPDHPEVAYVLTAYGLALLEGGDAAGAVEPLARARRLLDVMPEPIEHAAVDWPLARARWEVGVDRPAAIALAQGARAVFAAGGPLHGSTVAAIDAWLATRAR